MLDTFINEYKKSLSIGEKEYTNALINCILQYCKINKIEYKQLKSINESITSIQMFKLIEPELDMKTNIHCITKYNDTWIEEIQDKSISYKDQTIILEKIEKVCQYVYNNGNIKEKAKVIDMFTTTSMYIGNITVMKVIFSKEFLVDILKDDFYIKYVMSSKNPQHYTSMFNAICKKIIKTHSDIANIAKMYEHVLKSKNINMIDSINKLLINLDNYYVFEMLAEKGFKFNQIAINKFKDVFYITDGSIRGMKIETTKYFPKEIQKIINSCICKQTKYLKDPCSIKKLSKIPILNSLAQKTIKTELKKFI